MAQKCHHAIFFTDALLLGNVLLPGIIQYSYEWEILYEVILILSHNLDCMDCHYMQSPGTIQLTHWGRVMPYGDSQ